MDGIRGLWERGPTPPSKVTRRVLTAMYAMQPLAAYDLCRITGHGAVRVYRTLDRLEDGGYVVSEWETPEPTDQPRRRFYRLSPEGRRYALETLLKLIPRLADFAEEIARQATEQRSQNDST